MVIQLHTSFQSPTRQPAPAGTEGAPRRALRLFPLAALALFLISAGLSLSVFLYQRYLVRTIEAMDATLAAARKSFEPEFINEAARLHARIEAGKELLAAHRAPSVLFELLEKKTLESVRFRDFSFDAANPREPTLAVVGEAKSFNAVALQSDVFGEETLFVNPVFSNFSLNERGDVIFNFKAGLDAARLRYRETVIGAEAEAEAIPDAAAEGKEKTLEADAVP